MQTLIAILSSVFAISGLGLTIQTIGDLKEEGMKPSLGITLLFCVIWTLGWSQMAVLNFFGDGASAIEVFGGWASNWFM